MTRCCSPCPRTTSFRSATPSSRRWRAARRSRSRAKIVAFGVPPVSPETGYGYIRAARRLPRGLRREARRGQGGGIPGLRPVPVERRHLRGARLGLARCHRRVPPRHLQGLRARLPPGQARRQLLSGGSGSICRVPVRFDRLRGDGEDHRRDGGAPRRRLVRRRRLGRALGHRGEGRRRQRDPRRRACRRHAQRAAHRPASAARLRRPRGRGGDRDRRRGDGGAQGQGAGDRPAGGEAQGRRARRVPRAPQGAPARGAATTASKAASASR